MHVVRTADPTWYSSSMIAIILSIGDELALGQVVDTNSAWMSAQLASVGCAVKAHVTVSDSQRDIERAIRDAAMQCDVAAYLRRNRTHRGRSHAPGTGGGDERSAGIERANGS